ncbi:putative periplasmic binding protein-like I [Dioscorea sansibarensis]
MNSSTQAQVIIGPYTSSQAEFIIDLGNKTQIPIISFSATSLALAPARTPYFVRTTNNDSSQVAAISAFVKSFGWREVVPVYEDTSFGSGIIPYLVDAFQSIGAKVPYRSVISPSVNDDQLSEELYKLMTMQTRVFIVHMEPQLASRLFSKANEIGMMEEGYVWIMTDGVGNMLDSLVPRSLIDAMHGAVAMRSYMPWSEEIENNFRRRWKARFRQENPSIEAPDPSVFELRAYDTLWALAMAVENAAVSSSSFGNLRQGYNSTDLGNLSVSQNGPELLEAILNTRFKGKAGDFLLVNGQLNSSVYEIVNVIGKAVRRIAFWTPEFGISKQPNSNSSVNLNTVIWPGDTTSLPRGWEMPRNKERKLKVLVPVKNGFKEFVNVAHDNTTNRTTVTGYCIDVFEAVMQLLPYAVPYEYIPYPNASGQSADNYTEMIYQVYLQKFDAVVGDTTIIERRANYVDFTLPYTESGVSMIVPVKDKKRNMWIFLAPLSWELWLWTLGFFLFIGFILCLIEPRINPEFQGPPLQQLGMIFYFSFSTLTFAHRERLVSNLSRIIVLIWVFVVLILTSAYTASLTSLLTVPPLEPTVTDVSELLNNHKIVGYQDGSFVADLLKGLNFEDYQLKSYSSIDEYIAALNKGDVAAIFDDIPSLKLFVSQNCANVAMSGKHIIGKTYKAAHIAMVGKTYMTDGFGFVSFDIN